jgi:hypothetical protein
MLSNSIKVTEAINSTKTSGEFNETYLASFIVSFLVGLFLATDAVSQNPGNNGGTNTPEESLNSLMSILTDIKNQFGRMQV